MNTKLAIITLLILSAFLAASCRVGGGIGVGSGGTGLGLGVSTDLSSQGPESARANNRLAMNQFKEGNFENAAKIYQDTLDSYPDNADAQFYLGLSQIGMGERAQGFETLSQFTEPHKIRSTQEVRWWANYMSKKQDASFNDIYNTILRAREDGLEKDRQEEQDLMHP